MDASIEACPGPGLTAHGPDAIEGALAIRVERLAQELAVVLSEELPGCDGEAPHGVPRISSRDALSAAGAVEGLSRLVEAAQVLLAGWVDDDSDRPLSEPSLARQYGCANTVELLQRVTRAPARVLAKRVRLAGRVSPRTAPSGGMLAPRDPEVAEAFTAGRLSFDCASLISQTLEQAEHRAQSETLTVAEAELVAAASGSGAALPEHYDGMRVMCQVWKAYLDQDGPEPSETVPEHKRGLRLGKSRDGLVRVTGALLPETGAALGRLLDAMNAPAVLQRTVRFVPVEGVAGSGDAGSGVGADDIGVGDPVPRGLSESDHRTADQKRHDAFAALLQVAMKAPEVPNLGGAPVTVMIQVEQDDLEQQRGVGWVHGHDGELAPVPLVSVRHAVCAGAVQRVVSDKNGRIVEIGTAQRIFNAHQRRAITLRDGGCVIPGCTVPSTWCEVHHVTEHAEGGPTHTDNGALLCWYHHRSLGVSGWSIRMNHGVPEVQPPHWIDRERRWYRTGSPLRAPTLRRTG